MRKPGRNSAADVSGERRLSEQTSEASPLELPVIPQRNFFSRRPSFSSSKSSHSEVGAHSYPDSEGAKQVKSHFHFFPLQGALPFLTWDVMPQLGWLQRKRKGWPSVTGMIFGIGRSTATRRGSKLINPESPFAQAVTVVSCILLLYTAIITPVAVAFFWENDACDPLPTLPFDMFLDTFFMCEIVYTFFVAVHYQVSAALPHVSFRIHIQETTEQGGAYG